MKVTVMVQVVPGANDVPQLLAAVTGIPVMLSAAVPGFDRVIGKDIADVPTGVPEKESGFGVSTACGVGTGVPVPAEAIDDL